MKQLTRRIWNGDTATLPRLLATTPVLTLGQFTLVSQDPAVISDPDLKRLCSDYLPAFIRIWTDIEEETKIRWKCTSLIRDSPSHSKGMAIDLAPDVSEAGMKHYAVYKNSDPVLYKRGILLRQLQQLKYKDYGGKKFVIGIFVEPDHLHIQVLRRGGGEEFPTSLIKWKIPKPIYPDTYARAKGIEMMN